MKAILLGVLTSALVFSNAFATLYVYDPFNVGGPNGYVAEQSLSWAANNAKPAAEGAWTGPVTGSTSYFVSQTGLSYVGLETSGGSIYSYPWATNTRAFSETNIQTPVYYSFLINFSKFNNSVILGLAGTDGLLVSTGRVYEDGSLHTKSTGGAESAAGFQLSLNTTYLIVGRVSFSGTSTFTDLWVNPNPGDAQPGTPTLSGVGAAASGAAQWYSFLSQGPTGIPEYHFDEFRAGSTWESVTPATIPEPESMALLLAGLVAIAFCGRRRNPMAAK